jgi:hypothetical protein
MRLPNPRPAVRRLALPIVAVALVAACGSGSPSVAPPTASPVNPTPVISTPTQPPADAGSYWLRMTTWQAIPPLDLFGVTPTAVITADGDYLLPGAVPAIFPGPLVAPLFARQVSDAGRAQILAWADELGLLGGETDFTGGLLVPGGVTGRIELTVDGRLVTLTGLPEAVVGADPGTPEAFGEFWWRIASLPETLAGELGPEGPYAPTGYALLVGPAPAPHDGLSGAIADWPLEAALGSFGEPVANGTARCGLVEGEDAAALRPALEAANQLTQWTQDPETSATFGVTVRPIVAGENPCAEVFGVGG